MWQWTSDLTTNRAYQGFVGRTNELDTLRGVLATAGPRVAHVYGITGIGKTALLDILAAEAEDAGASVIRLDCRHIEPTEPGFLHALGVAIGDGGSGVDTLVERLGLLSPTVLLALDTYEVFRLLDTWLRQVFVPLLPDNVRIVFFSRQRPLDVWFAAPDWGRLVQSVPVQPLSPTEAQVLLNLHGIQEEDAASLIRAAHGHPLALKLAATASRENHARSWPQETVLQHAVDELSRMFLADVEDSASRHVLEGAVVLRRVTVSLLQALFPELEPQDAYERLRRLPFVDGMHDGLIIHEAVRDPLARSLHASDPSRYLDYRRSAWRQLVSESQSAASDDLWRYTADMLYLIENPVVREAFFPTVTALHSVEAAQPQDDEALIGIVRAHDGRQASELLLQWWRRMPQAFSIVRGATGEVEGLYCKLRSDQVEPSWLLNDPVTAQWYSHLEQSPMRSGEVALFCRRWLSLNEGDSPSEIQAAIWLDLKRSYMELRPGLRRVYLTATDFGAYQQVAQRLGFEVLGGWEVELDGFCYPSAVLDFGPASVDGWLAELAAAELGIKRDPALLDVEARQLMLAEGSVALTPLEFGVMRYLVEHQGKAVSRRELLQHVWGTRYQGGSNVVDAIVRTLRRKLGSQSARIETLTGVGYRLR
ncbi:winged helix-turn-helix domain-containing protein [Vreelandella titanicae]|uniref:winged helix-turn-helix domain-containing protein n=1 Tax=Vreelandella titanicae TaxID=664683 RepID=UPI00380EFFD1